MTITDQPIRNGVDTAELFATINAVGAQPELAQFRFRATNTWQSGTHTRGTISGFYGAGAEQQHRAEWTFDADHPAVLTGKDNGPLPVELVLLGLGSCLTSGLANIAAARGITLHSVTSTIEGTMDLQGILGLSDEVRNGYDAITVRFAIDADASPEQIEALVAQSRARSAVFDVLTNGVPVTIQVEAG